MLQFMQLSYLSPQVEQQCGWDKESAKIPRTPHKVCLLSGLQLIYDHPEIPPRTVINESQTYRDWMKENVGGG